MLLLVTIPARIICFHLLLVRCCLENGANCSGENWIAAISAGIP